MEKITNTKANTKQNIELCSGARKYRARSCLAHMRDVISGVLVPRVCYFSPLALRPRLLRVCGVLGIFSLLCAIFAGNTPVSAISLNLSLPSNSIKLEGIKPDGIVKESNPGTVSVTSDAPFGYTLSIKGKDASGDVNNSNKLINGSNILNPISKALSLADYQSSNEINTWAYKPSKLNGEDNNNYQVGPLSTSPAIIDNPKSVLQGTQEYSITLAAKIDSSLAAGTYQNTFVFSLIANTAHYNITYHLNGGTSGPGTSQGGDITSQTGDTIEPSITIGDPAPAREGYEFKGWCSVETSDASCLGGQTYTSGQTYILQGGNNTLELWAMWESSKPTTMQNFGSYCDSMRVENEDDIITLKDTRDGSTYRVAKLADGKCWMIDNLRIVGTTISNKDSDIDSGSWTIPNSINGFSSYDKNNAYYQEKNKDSNGDDYGAYYSWYTATAGTGTQSMSSGDAENSICPKGWRLPKGGSSTDTNEFSILDIAMGGTGYNRTNATDRDKFIHKPIPGFTYAGYIFKSSFNYKDGSGYYWSSKAYNQDEATHLDFFNNNGSLNPQDHDYDKYNGFSVRCIAREFKELSPDLLTQQFTPTTDRITIKAGDGIELIMVADGTDNWKPYYAAPGTDVSLLGYGRPYIISITPKSGYKLKVIEQSPDGTITAIGEAGSYPYMQDFTSDQCTTKGTNVTDTRNNVSYTVARIGDKCWMLSDLRLAAGITLTSVDSNINGNFTTPTDSPSDEDTSPRMKECHGIIGNGSANSDCSQSGPVTEYYYNWKAAKANTSSASSNGYSICPKNWTLPNYDNEITTDDVWNNGANPGMLAAIGSFQSGSQDDLGSLAYWWAPSMNVYDSGNTLYLTNSLGVWSWIADMSYAGSVRCMLTN